MARYISTADTAKQIRATLKAEFPGVKFTVRSKTYSGGSSIDVNWVDGPATKNVQPVLDRFVGSTFDSMTDLRTGHSTLIANPDGTIEEIRYLANHVFGHRDHSAEFRSQIIAELERTWGFKYDQNSRTDWNEFHSDLYYRLAGETSCELVK